MSGQGLPNIKGFKAEHIEAIWLACEACNEGHAFTGLNGFQDAVEWAMGHYDEFHRPVDACRS